MRSDSCPLVQPDSLRQVQQAPHEPPRASSQPGIAVSIGSLRLLPISAVSLRLASVKAVRLDRTRGLASRASKGLDHALSTNSPMDARIWPSRIRATAFICMTGYSAYLAFTLFRARCEGFSCTYLGLGWAFWLVAICVPATAMGWYVNGDRALPRFIRRCLRLVWLGHSFLGAGLAVWWLIQGV